jgi:2-oxoglutarate-Fe(II)-dependent oxygenase superfamily protein
VALLRADVLRFPGADGGLDLLDLLLDTLHSLSPAEAELLGRLEGGELAAGAPEASALSARLEGALLWEGPVAEQIRRERHAARLHRWAESAEPGEEPEPDWPPVVACEALASEWRDPERYRRLREERLAGREVFVLRGLVAPEAARAWAAEAASLPFERLATPHVEAERCALGEQLAPLQALLRDADFRRLLGAVLGRELGESLLLNAWRMSPGDRMAVHPDGPRYLATFSLGLCPDWTASRGGAIAFGDPSPEGLVVRERFLPHLGDACVFAPHARAWHAVERVREGQRLSVTGWWLSE